MNLWRAALISLILLTSQASADVALSSFAHFALTSDTALRDATLTKLITDSSKLPSFGDEPIDSSDSVSGHLDSLSIQQLNAENPAITANTSFDTPFNVPSLFPSGHCFFIPEVSASDGEFYWRTAPKPSAQGTPIAALFRR